MKLPLRLTALTFLLAPGVAAAQEAGDNLATEISPEAYTGVWYEVARTPTPFQQQCAGGVTALYELIDADSMRVLNRCDTGEGEVQGVEGTADVVDSNFNTFDVEFPQSPDSPGVNYVIAAVGPMENGSYPWSAVHSPDAGLGWILSRSVELDPTARQEAEDALEAAGIDIAHLEDTAQPPENYDPEQE